ncbi:uncharacterized protein N7511_006494 [Penicillium nucicola]|uniref:uncharacterized protein n=1 Tax=Penicillium nucicola TaxID=1850975 RepID=UPI00254561E7|nr:uncharacterized protein N7511_006494 [Penicillium nucicola]KAJ5757800.1 hypothetical protein N7511_006494 [Penicillium nucicola]
MPDQLNLSPTLDHIVILVSHDTLSSLPDQLKNILIVAPGGNHADGLTSNKLVLFKDGVYIEFIAFFNHVDAKQRSKHRWGNLKEGTVIDWAFTAPHGVDFASIRQRVLNGDTGFMYEEPAHWGRKRADGVMLEWTLSAARGTSEDVISPGWLPFWVFDITPRNLRVPYAVEPAMTEHPSGVNGISSLSILVPEQVLSSLVKTYAAIYGENIPAVEGAEWGYEVPAGSNAGRQTISLLKGSPIPEVTIKMAFKGLNRGSVELLPGLIVEIE